MTKPIFPQPDSDIVSDEEMKEVVAKGIRVIIEHDNVRLTTYQYNNHVYVYDVENID